MTDTIKEIERIKEMIVESGNNDVPSDDLIEKLAWEVSKNVIDHHKWVYSEIFKNAPSTFPISLRNGIYNEIKSAIKCHTEQDIIDWLERSEKHRKEMRKITRKSKNKF